MKRSKIIRWFFNKLYKIRAPEFVQYWKTGDMARAKLVTLEDNSYAMYIEGEKYPLYGFPRGPVLYGPLARLKFKGKNLIFNEVWKLLEEGKTNAEVMAYIKNVALTELLRETMLSKYDMIPPEHLCPAVRELWRAMEVVQGRLRNRVAQDQFDLIKRGFTFFLQEDDAYRFRFQWVAKYLNPRTWYRKLYRFFTRTTYSFSKEMNLVFSFLEDAEVTPDMKGRIKLIRRVLTALMEDKEFGNLIEQLIGELDWKKLYLSKSDLYFFRGKYFKVDAEVYDY